MSDISMEYETFFFNDFRSHSGLRTVEIVRKEIQELEDLMNGKKILHLIK